MKRTQMRDTIKDIKYFTTFINEEQARVKKFSFYGCGKGTVYQFPAGYSSADEAWCITGI